MNILFIWEHYYPELGGLERSTERLAIGLQKYYKARVTILTSNFPWEESYSIRNGVQIVRSWDFWKMDYISLKSGIDSCKEKLWEHDIISLFGIWDQADTRYWNVIFEDRAPSTLKIWTSGDIDVKWIDRNALRKFEWHLCQNPWIESELLDLWIPRDTIFSIRNGLDINDFLNWCPSKTQAREQLRIPQSKFVIGGIWRFVRRKNFDLIIEAFFDFYNQCDDKPLILLQWSDFGQSDGIESELRHQLTKLPNEAFILLPASENTEVALSASDAFITLWDREWAPNIILEAQVLWKPVIATDIPGHRVYLDNWNGILVNKNVIEVSQAMHDVRAKEYSPEDILENAEKFEVKKTAWMYMSAYQQILNNK